MNPFLRGVLHYYNWPVEQKVEVLRASKLEPEAGAMLRAHWAEADTKAFIANVSQPFPDPDCYPMMSKSLSTYAIGAIGQAASRIASAIAAACTTGFHSAQCPGLIPRFRST